FNVVSLLLCLVISVVLFPYVSLPADTLKAAQQGKPIHEFEAVNIGPDFGAVSVADMMEYYMLNPPQKQDNASAAVPKQHFGGC
nr:hypothetical protein [Gammaproteobacteria bacterium]